MVRGTAAPDAPSKVADKEFKLGGKYGLKVCHHCRCLTDLSCCNVSTPDHGPVCIVIDVMQLYSSATGT